MPVFSFGSRMRGICVALLAVTSILAGAAKAAADTSWAMLDADRGVFLGDEGGSRVRPPASLAKMMTLYITFEALRAGRLHWDDRIVVSRNASVKIPTKLWVKAGDTISVREAVDGMIVVSANDAATAIGEHMAGSEAAFGRVMTQRAKRLGMRSTVFSNPSGLTDGHRQATTARDMALLGLALRRDFPKEYRLFSQPSFVFRGKLRRGHNNLMYRYDGVDGIKTGFTNAAGYNLVSSLAANGRHFVGVVLGGRTARKRDDLMARLLTRFSGQDAGQPEARQPLVAARIPLPSPRPEMDLTDETLIEQGDGGAPVWQIQIGAVPSQAAARTLLDRASGLVGSVDVGVKARIEQTVSGGKTLYRARFSGFADKTGAAQACAVLKQGRFDCFALGTP
jgi:D-alanyl-D-alanine carboxypeptidase/D-alanyl-D-alanine carboxypeptidase (penicillin-binding protein 5/6)